LVYCLSQRI